MKQPILIIIVSLLIGNNLFSQNNLPGVYPGNEGNDLISTDLTVKAERAFNQFRVPPKNKWEGDRKKLRNEIIENTEISFYPDLPLDYRETKHYDLDGYTIKNIYFQTRPGVYATANLFIPDGEGPFPGIIVMMGHSRTGKLSEAYQSVGHSLALNGYVSLNIDPWGAGERTTSHGEFEYHGANLGASLLNVGETLMGVQVTDNMRAIDLLCSFPFVDPEKIGATGASGGGNQTMWLAAMDERVKAAVPVVSVGTFQSYILNSNCVCEMLPNGLTFTEESSVLGLVAPRALKICNASKDSNRAFYPSEMLRSFEGARTIYSYYEAEENLSYAIADTRHGYMPEMRSEMLGWFDLHLKGKGSGKAKEEIPFTLLTETELMVFPEKERPAEVASTRQFCYDKGIELKKRPLSRRAINPRVKRAGLEAILKVPGNNVLTHVHDLPNQGDWGRVVLETTKGEQVPLLIYLPNIKSTRYTLLGDARGKKQIPGDRVERLIKNGNGICIVDLWGIGENGSPMATSIDGNLPEFHTLSRSTIWLGSTMQGVWVSQLQIVLDWLKTSYEPKEITIDLNREIAVAGLLSSALGDKTDKLILRGAPLSYLMDKKGDIDHFSMAIHIPGFLTWGDISLTAALAGKEIRVVDPVSITGRLLEENEIEAFTKEFNDYDRLLKTGSKIIVSKHDEP